jgi:hypothetical protein
MSATQSDDVGETNLKSSRANTSITFGALRNRSNFLFHGGYYENQEERLS